MPRTRTIFVPAGLLSLLILTSQAQAESADQTTAQTAEDTAIQLPVDGNKETSPQKDGSDNPMDTAHNRDQAAREKAKEIIKEMQKRFSTQ